MNCAVTDDSREYLEFLQKFEAKKTTDDCYTPAAVYSAVRAWCETEYGTAGRRVVRPFYPGGDYQSFPYEDGDVVIDNPPFSILAKIVRFYEQTGVDFFLFAPALTTFSVNAKTSIITDSVIEYANRAKIKTNFITSLDDKSKARSAPKLKMAIEEAQKKEKAPKLPCYTYPANVISSARLLKIASVEFSIKHCEAFGRVGALDSQWVAGKTIFGGGYIISTAAVAELKAAKLKAERDEVEWQLSERELAIIAGLDKGGMV